MTEKKRKNTQELSLDCPLHFCECVCNDPVAAIDDPHEFVCCEKCPECGKFVARFKVNVHQDICHNTS